MMKRIGWMTLIGLFASTWAVDCASAAENRVGKFTVVAGSVDTIREQRDAPIAAELGMDAFLDDVVRTKRRSRTQLRFLDDSVLNMGPNHMVKIKEYVYDEDKGVRKAILSSLRGTVRATVSKLGVEHNLFEVETPTAVASVRGTDFIVKVNSSNMTQVYVLEGAVAVHNVNPKIKGIVIVHAGQKTQVQRSKAPTPPVLVPKQEQKLVVAETTPPPAQKTKQKSKAVASKSSQTQTGAAGGGSTTAKTSTSSTTAPPSTAATSAAPAPANAPPPPVATVPVAPPPPAPVAIQNTAPKPVIVAKQQQTQPQAVPPVTPPITNTIPALKKVPVTMTFVF